MNRNAHAIAVRGD